MLAGFVSIHITGEEELECPRTGWRRYPEGFGYPTGPRRLASTNAEARPFNSMIASLEREVRRRGGDV
jgi:hypothetical protein